MKNIEAFAKGDYFHIALIKDISKIYQCMPIKKSNGLLVIEAKET